MGVESSRAGYGKYNPLIIQYVKREEFQEGAVFERKCSSSFREKLLN